MHTFHRMKSVLQPVPPEVLLAGQQRIFGMVARAEPVQQTLSEIAKFAEACFPGVRASILIWSEREEVLRRGGYGQLPESFADAVDGLTPGPAQGSCGTCAFRRERVITRDVELDPLWADHLGLCAEHGIRAAWSSPLLSPRDQSLLGVFGMYYPFVGEPSQSDIDFVDGFAHLATLALQRHREDENARLQALHDSLTQLGNRRMLESVASEWLGAAAATAGTGCVVFVDLDKFETYNVGFGFPAGDRILREIAGVLGGSLRPGEHAVRVGGDEFVLLLNSDLAEACARVDALRQQLRRGVELDRSLLTVRFSAGLADARLDPRMDRLLYLGNEANRRAKALGGDQTFVIQDRIVAELRRRGDVVRFLGEAVATDRITPALQPIVNLATGEVAAFELLFRVGDERLADVPVYECIQIAEEHGEIHGIGMSMFRAAGHLQSRWGDVLAGRKLNINVSVRQLDRPDFLDLVAELVAEGGLDPSRTCLELTESTMLELGSHQGEALASLKALGFAMSLDDFGTGYASLTSLRSEIFDVVKVDRSFVRDVATSSVDRTLCEVMHSMCRARGIQILAEGVETEEQAAALRALGYDFAQGYHFARPMPAEQALSWLEEYSVVH